MLHSSCSRMQPFQIWKVRPDLLQIPFDRGSAVQQDIHAFPLLFREICAKQNIRMAAVSEHCSLFRHIPLVLLAQFTMISSSLRRLRYSFVSSRGSLYHADL